MKLDESVMKKIIKEEYDKRINYFLNEKITITDKRGVNVLQFAKGLKVLDQAGNQYTFDTIVKQENEEFAKLYLPDEPREDAFGKTSASTLHEDERGETGFYSRVRDGVKDIQPVGDQDYLFDNEVDYSTPGIEDLSVDDKENNVDRTNKLPDRKYILVPMGEFEERFRLKIEE